MATAQVEERTLLKAMSWWDGFVVALANPAFLIAGLGGSIGALGTGGAFLLVVISICLGALQNNIHAELASMFPSKSGGVALYAHEAWRKYTTLIGPLATFGYWIGWSVVLAVNGLVAGTLVTAEWFSDSTWSSSGAGLTQPADRHRHRVHRDRVALQRLRRAAGRVVRLRDRRADLHPGVRAHVPALHHGRLVELNINFDIGANGGLPLALVWLYFMCWSSYGIEVVATFAPEYHDSQRDTRMALRSAALFSALVYVLLPLGAGGILGTEVIAADATLIAWYTQAFDALVGNFLGGVMIFCVVAGLLLSMNTATMDGSRALYGIAKDGMTIRQFGSLNRFRVARAAMTVDALLNVLLISFFNNPIEIIAVSNIGYVFATCAALSGFLLLRKDRPSWPRPVHRVSGPGSAGAFLLTAHLRVPDRRRLHLLRRVPRHRGLRLRLGQDALGAARAAARVRALRRPPDVVQDKEPIRWREEVPATPEEQRAHPELAVAETTAPV